MKIRKANITPSENSAKPADRSNLTVTAKDLSGSKEEAGVTDKSQQASLDGPTSSPHADQEPETNAPSIRQLTPELAGEKLEKKPFNFKKQLWRNAKMQNRLNRSLALNRISDSRLEDLADLAKEYHPLPRESQLAIKKTHLNWFLAQLKDLNSDQDLVDFAYSLNHRELSLLFPILASIKKKSSLEKIRTLILLRQSKVLYISGWVTLQYIYPNAKTAKALADLCQDLEALKLPGFQNADNLTDFQTNLYYPHFAWPEIHLISEVCSPDHRHFIQKIVRHLLNTGTNPVDFFEAYGIYHDLALGTAILADYELEKLELKLAGEVNNDLPSSPQAGDYPDLEDLTVFDDDLL